MIEMKKAFRLDVDLAPSLDVGAVPGGFRRVIPIAGGRVSGERLSATILPGGADWNMVRSDTIVHLWARYTLRTDDGVLISIINEGFQRGPVDTMAKILAGEPIDTSNWYARTRPVFEVSHPDYAWLNQAIFLGDLLAPTRPDQVSIDIYEIL